MLITGVGLGAGLSYWFDPDRGKRRRARVRDKVAHGFNVASDAIGKTSRDIENRASGALAGLGSLLRCEEVTDDVLVARVRSKLGRFVSHPKAIEVTAADGHVTLTGPILAREVDSLLSCVSSIPGVKEVEDRLEAREQAGSVSALQGEQARSGERCELMQANWSPTARLFVGAAGGALMTYGARRKDILGVLSGACGSGLLARALTNIEVARLFGVGTGRRAVEIQKAINIAAPVEEVFDFWLRHENFPTFMSNVREVREIGEGRYHWTVAGPMGVSVEWDAEITRLIPNELLAWKSLPGSAIEQAGVIHFNAVSDSDTVVDIRMSYNPPAGAIGHLAAVLLGSDPKSEMDEDLMRMKSFIETGRAPHDAARKSIVNREAAAS
jgi:uncharacterized membrane protein